MGEHLRDLLRFHSGSGVGHAEGLMKQAADRLDAYEAEIAELDKFWRAAEKDAKLATDAFKASEAERKVWEAETAEARQQSSVIVREREAHKSELAALQARVAELESQLRDYHIAAHSWEDEEHRQNRRISKLEEALCGLLEWRDQPEVRKAFELLRDQGQKIGPARNATLGMAWSNATKALDQS